MHCEGCAVEGMMHCLQWREEFGVDDLYQNHTEKFNAFRPKFKAAYPTGFHQTDRRGHPLYFERIGAVTWTCIFPKGLIMASSLRWQPSFARVSFPVSAPMFSHPHVQVL